jgi:hypothetical protein
MRGRSGQEVVQHLLGEVKVHAEIKVLDDRQRSVS